MEAGELVRVPQREGGIERTRDTGVGTQVVTKETSSVVKLIAEPGWLGDGIEEKKEIISLKPRVVSEDGLRQSAPIPIHPVAPRLIF